MRNKLAVISPFIPDKSTCYTEVDFGMRENGVSNRYIDNWAAVITGRHNSAAQNAAGNFFYVKAGIAKG